MSFINKLMKRKEKSENPKEKRKRAFGFFGRRNRSRDLDEYEDDGQEPEWDDIVLGRSRINLNDAAERRQYIRSCLTQLTEAERELDTLNYEYKVVTSHLTDVEELENLPEDQREKITETASHISRIEGDKVSYDKKRHMSEDAYEAMLRMEDEVEEGIRKLRETEEYQGKVKADLRKLNSEKLAFQMRHQELEDVTEACLGTTKLCLAAVPFCFAILLALQIGLEMDARLGYVLTVCIMVLVVVVMYTRLQETKREITRLERDMNKLTQLINTVKIRYVNNKNLLDYLRLKFHVESCAMLEKRWADYRTEKEERAALALAIQDLDYYQRELLKLLRHSRIHDTSVWLHQVDAIVDPKEMVELRHELITRRQALRSQMEHNQKLAESARAEIEDISTTYPKYAREILNLVEDAERSAGKKRRKGPAV